MPNMSVRNRVQMFEHRGTPTGSEASQGLSQSRRNSGDGWSNPNPFAVSNSPRVVSNGRTTSSVVSGGGASSVSSSRRQASQPFEPFEQSGFSKKGSRHGKLEWPLDDEDDDIAREIANVPKITLSRPAAKKSSPQTQKQPVLWKQQQKVRQPQKTHQPQGEKYGNGAPSPFKRIIPDNRSQRGGVAWPPSKKEVEERDERSSMSRDRESENEVPRIAKLTKAAIELSNSKSFTSGVDKQFS